jgi:hypothetical protein
MPEQPGGSRYLELLRGQIDLTRVPFSDRGSRIVVVQSPGRSSLQVRLGERLTELNPNPEAYLARPAFIDSLQFIDPAGQALPFEPSGSPDVAVFQTRHGKFRLVFADESTLAIGLPSQGAAGIRLHVNHQHYRASEAHDPLRSLIYSSNGQPARNKVTADATGVLIEYTLQPGRDRTILLAIGEVPILPAEIPGFSEFQRKALERWTEWFERVPPVDEAYAEKYAFAWWVMANNLISPRGCISFEGMAPSKASYIGLWLWDSALHAIAYRHLDPGMARDQIRAFLALQRPDGMIPDAIFDEAAVFELDHPIHGEVTKPPILAWAALKIHETAPDISFLKEIYPGLARLNNWWFQHNDPQHHGLAQYLHPYSSGLDDSPLFDHGLPVEAPDLNTYLHLSMRSLAKMARVLRLKSEATLWELGADLLIQRMLERLWDEEAGIFNFLHDEQPIPVVTPLNLLPLWTGRLPPRVARRLTAILKNKRKFWGRLMLPTVARDDAAFDPETMWRGPVWANINYFFIEALGQLRKKELARELRSATLQMIMSQPGIYEYYSAETGEPPARSVPAFGWTAALFIDLALQASRETGLKEGP